jgi:multiple sugar transport system substrate-binding protein
MEKKMIGRRDFLKLSSLTAAGLALAACAPSVQQAAPTEAPKAQPVSNEPVRWTFWPEWGGKDADALHTQVQNYDDGAKTICEFLPIRDHARMIAAMSAGNPPDLLMTWDAEAVGGWAYAGGIRDLGPYIKDSNMDLTDFLPIGLKSGSLMGTKQIGLPLSNYICTVLFWNKDAFKKAGLDPETPPQTWEELWEMNKKITVLQNGQIQTLGYEVLTGQDAHYQAMAFAFGGSIWGKDYRTVTPDSDESVASLNWMRQFYKEYTTDEMRRWTGSANQGLDAPTNPLYTGNAAMQITGEWTPSFVAGLQGIKVDLGAGYMPYSTTKPDGKGTMCANSAGMVIPSGAKSPDAAFNFMKFISIPENSAAMCSIVGNASPTKKGIELQIAKTSNPTYKMILEQIWTKANVVPLNTNTPIGKIYSDAFVRYRAEVVEDGKDAAERMKALKAEIQPQLDATLKKLGI